ncbi:MAG: cell division protein FtsA [Abitibacteriaceae bacterium]|nr:cell division protein FtsA [Abditibacteriaceae bacterium]
MSREDAVVGLDIGTTKVCTVVGQGDAQGKITILGVGVVPSRGLKKGVVIDVEDTVAAIRESVERARHMAGIEFSTAVAGVTGDHIQSSNRRGTVTVAGAEQVITQDDVERVLAAANMDVPRDREIIHSLPRDFAVDGHRGVRRPVGMCGQRLEVETHVVTGTASFLQNVVQCVERAGLNVEALVLEPIATSEAVATADERELGVILIDIGGGTSDIAVFQDGSIIFSDVLSVGGNHVTRDISIGLRTPLDIAERLKIERGVASPALIGHGEALEVVTAGSGERLRLPRAILGEIIEARMSELFEMARDVITAAGIQKRVPAGVVLTGGGALLPGAIELAQQIFDSPVRLGRPIELSGWSDQVDNPQFSTAVGLLRFALRQRGALGNSMATMPMATNSHLSSVLGDAQRQGTVTNGDGTASYSAEGTLHETPAEVASVASNGEGDQENGLYSEAARDSGQTTPFDHLRQQGQTERYNRASNVSAPPDAGQSFLQRLVTKLRQLIGFEMS